MSTSYNISKQVEVTSYDPKSRKTVKNTILDSKKVAVADLSPAVLAEDDVFSLTAFTDDSTAELDMVKAQMTSLRDAIDWKSDIGHKPYSSERYGKGYAVTIMKKAVVPKVNFDDMNGFIASLAGNSSS
tara:strand:+ start:1653 stop:2039 length:387 start_codon:yes stop_codon:yes gene_type:complete